MRRFTECICRRSQHFVGFAQEKSTLYSCKNCAGSCNYHNPCNNTGDQSCFLLFLWWLLQWHTCHRIKCHLWLYRCRIDWFSCHWVKIHCHFHNLLFISDHTLISNDRHSLLLIYVLISSSLFCGSLLSSRICPLSISRQRSANTISCSSWEVMIIVPFICLYLESHSKMLSL